MSTQRNVTVYSATDHITFASNFSTLNEAHAELAGRGFSFVRHFDVSGARGEMWHKPSTATSVGARGIIKEL